MTAVYKAVKHFEHLLEGRDFTIQTDHKPLIFAFVQKAEKASPRQIRQLDYIGQFTTNLIHIPGSHKEVADALSRLDIISMPVVVNTTELAQQQLKDPKDPCVEVRPLYN